MPLRLRFLLLLACGALSLDTATAQERLGGRVHDGHPATSSPLPDVIQDGSFEAGTPNDFWDEFSANFGTPVCDPGCGIAAARTGSWWVWFGGIASPEEGSVSQDVVLEDGEATLTFWLQAAACDSDQDYIEVLVDGNQEFFLDGSSPACGATEYTEHTVDLSSYADGGTHTVEFHSETFATNGDVTNFFVDDVVLDNTTTAIEAGPDGTPGTHALSAPYPNPARGEAALSLEVAETQRVRVEVYDALGKRVALLHDGPLAAGGAHRLALDGSALAAGVYVVRAVGERFSDLRTITLTR